MKARQSEETDELRGGGLRYQDEHTGTSILFWYGLQSGVLGQINFTQCGCCFIPPDL